MPLPRRRVNKDVAGSYEADRRLAGEYRDRLAAAGRAEETLRAAQAAGGPDEEIAALRSAFDRALTGALAAAQAAERAEIGPKGYAADEQDAKARRAAEIHRRKGLAKPAVQPWTAEIDRLRTVREQHRLGFRDRPATVPPAWVA
ncbi:plectin [Actinomadura macrotermitis]|uniref:Plectin n=1 Tax=Actinomadura macrotermitis TaxID=2585200 RepID=A0A7K0C6P5_9ACTN|nr:plectin [Actinomadura macrotermitis]MQY09016.1 hypothetical protein [Actinomadura macrotermitis]